MAVVATVTANGRKRTRPHSQSISLYLGGCRPNGWSFIPLSSLARPSLFHVSALRASIGAMSVEPVIIGRATLYNADCCDVLPKLTGADLVFTSPPYNLGGAPWKHLGNWKQGDSAGGKSKWKNGSDAASGIQYGDHDDAMPWPEYVAWQRAVVSELWRLTEASQGAIFYNHKPRVIGAKLWQPTELLPSEIIHRQTNYLGSPRWRELQPNRICPDTRMDHADCAPRLSIEVARRVGIGRRVASHSGEERASGPVSDHTSHERS
jgi:hypothetical protein